MPKYAARTEVMTAENFQKLAKKKKVSELETYLAGQLENANIPFQQQYKFHPEKDWRADFLIGTNLLCECDGGTFSKPKLKMSKAGKPYMTKSAHSSGTGIAKDMLRQNEATILGYKILRFDTNMVKDGTALVTVLRMLGHGKNKSYLRGKSGH